MDCLELTKQLSCPCCSHILIHPVTLKCGHSFCRACLDNALDAQQWSSVFSCPVCGDKSPERPEIHKNLALHNIIEIYHTSKQQQLQLKPPARDEDTKHKVYKLRNVLKRLETEINETDMKSRSLGDRQTQVREKTADKEERVAALFRDIRRQLDDLEKRVVSEISQQAERLSASLTKLSHQLVASRVNLIEERKRNMHELSEIESALPPNVLAELEEADAGDTQENREEPTEQIQDVGDHGPTTIPQQPRPATKDELILDIDTASFQLHISDDRKSASRPTSQSRPDSPNRFWTFPQVLSTRAFSSGQHSWEVDIGGIDWCSVAMCYPSMDRNGRRSKMEDNTKAWCLVKLDNQYFMKHNWNLVRPPVRVSSNRIRVSLDYEAGQISFYELSDPVQLLHTFTTTFTEPLHAALGVYSDVGCMKIVGYNQENRAPPIQDVEDLDMIRTFLTLHAGLIDIIHGVIHDQHGRTGPTPSIHPTSTLQEPKLVKEEDLILQEPKLVKEEDLILDIDTASFQLQISDDRKSASRPTSQSRPDSPNRFWTFPQVLSTRTFSSGQHSWEVDIGGIDWCGVAMCYPSMDRNGRRSKMEDNTKAWCLVKLDNQYFMKHNWKEVRPPVKVSSNRIRVSLYYEAGQISFYELSDPVQLLHTFTTTFTEPLHAALGVYSDVGCMKIVGYNQENTAIPIQDVEVLDQPGRTGPTPSIPPISTLQEPKLVEEEDLILDIETAIFHLHISDDRKSASRPSSILRPYTPNRFWNFPQVLSTRKFSSGRHSWEVDIRDIDWCCVAMCYPSVDRTGRESKLEDNTKAWCVVKLDNKYFMKHNWKEVRPPVKVSGRRIRVSLDYEAGQISFYELGDPILLLHTFATTFTEPLHAALGVYSDVGCMTIVGYNQM